LQRSENGRLGSPSRPGLHLRQWVSPSSTRLSPMTPMPQLHLHFLGNRGIRLSRTRSESRELPPYPGHYPGPWLGPLSFIARHTPVRPPCKVGRVGTSFDRASPDERATNDMSQFRWFHTRTRRILLVRPAGLSITVDDPIGRSHHPRARRLPRINSAAELHLTAPCSSLSLIRSLFRPRGQRTVRRRTDLGAGFPPCGRPRAGHSGDRRFGDVAASDSGSISFVSYPPLQVGSIS
jgi:hypothetical protein